MYSMFYVLDLNVYLSYYLPSLQWDLEENVCFFGSLFLYDVFGFGVLLVKLITGDQPILL
ncbi:hypothetical protein ACJX0J_014817, partial [Zea mays]